jgi:hypothetical protein
MGVFKDVKLGSVFVSRHCSLRVYIKATMPTDRAKLYIFKYTLRLQCLLIKTEPSFTSLNTPLGYNAY